MAEIPRSSFSSVPSEPGVRRLGIRSSSTGERPIRPQWILLGLAAVVVLVLPLYWMRSPSAAPVETPQAATSGFAPTVPVEAPKAATSEAVSLGTPQRIRCGASVTSTSTEGTMCDALPTIEESLAKAIRESVDCAPTKEAGTINHVLRVDFAHKTLHVFPGKSGYFKGPQARRATKCVKQALVAPDWEKVQHRFAVYEIAILAKYQPPSPTQAPLFE